MCVPQYVRGGLNDGSLFLFAGGTACRHSTLVRRSAIVCDVETQVRISHPTSDDKQAYRRAVCDSQGVLRPWIKLDDSVEAFDTYLRRYEQHDQCAYLIRQVDNEQLVGFVNANNIIHGAFRSTFLGFGAFSGGEGRGLMLEGVRLAISDLFTCKGLHRAEANIQPENKRSIRLVERLGFRKEGFSPGYLFIDGEWRDHERWALTAEMLNETMRI